MRAILKPDDIRMMEMLLTRRDLRYGLLWRLGVSTGLRISDLLRLRKKDLFGKTLTVKENKTGKSKTIDFDILTKIAIDWFLQGHTQLKNDDFVFYRNYYERNVPISRQWASTVIRLTARSIGLENIAAHSMRKIYACEKYRSSGSIEAVRKALNHSKIETTMYYLRDVI